MEDGVHQSTSNDRYCMSKALKFTLLLLNCTLMIVGTGGPLLLRVYFLHGGKRLWLSSLVQVGGWPLLLIPFSISSIHHRHLVGESQQENAPVPCLLKLTPRVATSCAAIGLVTGLDCYLFAFSAAYLPVSTSCLLSSTQMAFTALFAFLIVKQRFTPFSINSVVLLTLGAVVLGVHATRDRPTSMSRFHYYLGFVMSIAAAGLYGLVLPLMELMFIKAKQKIVYSLVMEMQIVISFFASLFCVVGMAANKDFQRIGKEASEFGLGEGKYYMVVIMGGVFSQMYSLGLMGTISCSSSLFAGIVGAALLPVAEVVAVVFFHERFDGGKGVSLALSLWGFFSYWYGELRHTKKPEVEEVQLPSSS